MRINPVAVAACAVLGVLALAVVVGMLLPGPARPAAAESDPTPVPVAPSTTTLAPSEQPGSPRVRFSEAAAEHPAAGGVRALLQTYFDAINLGDYRRWTTTVLTERGEATSERAWRERYADRTYGSILVQRIAPRLSGGMVVLLTFSTVQDPAEPGPRCLRWHVSYPVARTEFGQLRLARSTADDKARQPCGSTG